MGGIVSLGVSIIICLVTSAERPKRGMKLSLTERSAAADVSAELAGSTWTCRSLLWADDCFALDPELVECCLLEGLSLCCDLVLES
jgi:hypothetical protein